MVLPMRDGAVAARVASERGKRGSAQQAGVAGMVTGRKRNGLERARARIV